MPRVLNIRTDFIPRGSVNVMRPTCWGNPFPLERFPSREVCLENFIVYLKDRPQLVHDGRRLMYGRDLVCCCAPKLCHAHVWREVANSIHFLQVNQWPTLEDIIEVANRENARNRYLGEV